MLQMSPHPQASLLFMQSHREVFDFFSRDEITGNQVVKHGLMNCSTGRH